MNLKSYRGYFNLKLAIIYLEHIHMNKARFFCKIIVFYEKIP